MTSKYSLIKNNIFNIINAFHKSLYLILTAATKIYNITLL